MLQSMRNNMHSWPFKLILAAAALSFAAFGMESLFSSRGGDFIAKVNGEKIYEPELQRAMQLEKRRRIMQMGENIDAAQLEDSVIRQPVMDSLIQRKLLMSSAEEKKIGVSQQQLDTMIVQNENFQEDGKFSEARFRNLLSNNGFTPQLYKSLLREEVMVKQLSSGIADSEFITDKDSNIFSQISNQTRDVFYITLPAEKVRESITISDADIQAYYEENADKFQTQEEVVLEYITMGLEDFYPEVSDADIQQKYDEEKAVFEPKTTKRVSHILVKLDKDTNEQAATEALNAAKARIAAGEDFAVVAKEVSEDIGSKNTGGDLGQTDGTTFPADFEEVIVNLNAGDLSDPVKTDAGMHLVKVASVDTTKMESFDDARMRIKTDMQKSRAQETYVSKLEELGDVTYTAEDLGDAADLLNKQVKVTEKLTRQSNAGIAQYPAVITAAFSEEVLKEGNNSQVIETSDSESLVIRVKEHIKPMLKPLDTVKAGIKTTLLAEKVREQMTQKADSLIADIKKGETLKQLAAANDAKVEGNTGVSRQKAQGIPMPLMQAAFDLPSPGKSQTLVSQAEVGNGDIAVFTVANATAGEPDPAMQNEFMLSYLARTQGYDTLRAYNESLKAGAKIQRR